MPGVTAGVAAPAYAGIPVTHREAASAVAFVTGHEDPAKPDSALDWNALAAFPGTLVVYMGVRQLDAIATQLLAGGRPADEPAALVQRGTLPDQRAVHATLSTIASVAAAEGIKAPAIAIFGAVTDLHERLAWYERPPLAGRTVAVTRARAQASGLAARLRALGADVVEAPAIKIVPLDGPAPPLERYDLVILTSPNGARLLFQRLVEAGCDARGFAASRVAAIGPGTAAALAEHGIMADIVPERFVAEGLVEALADVPVERALIARAAEARDVLVEALRARGAEVDTVALYETVAEELSDGQLAQVSRADYVTFTSSSTVRFFLDAAGERLSPDARLVSIGPVTSDALRERGREPHVEAEHHDIDGVVQALLDDVPGAGLTRGPPRQGPGVPSVWACSRFRITSRCVVPGTRHGRRRRLVRGTCAGALALVVAAVVLGYPLDGRSRHCQTYRTPSCPERVQLTFPPGRAAWARGNRTIRRLIAWGRRCTAVARAGGGSRSLDTARRVHAYACTARAAHDGRRSWWAQH